MRKIVMLSASLGLLLSAVGCGLDLEPSKRPPASPPGIAPTGGLDELSQPVKTPPQPAPDAPPAP